MTFDFFMPTKVLWGKNSVLENAEIFSEFGKKCLILTGKSGAKKSGALDDAFSALNSRGIEYVIFDEIGENPLISTCHKAGKTAFDFSADFILAIGGGSVLDASKAVAIYASNQYLAPIDIYKRKYDNSPLPVLLIGTTAGTGSEVTSVGVLTDDNTNIKKSIKGADCYAKVSFCDPKYTYSMPYSVTVSTALDAFAHAVEGFFTPNCEGVLKLFAQQCIPSIYSCLCKLSESKEVSRKTRDELYYGSIVAGLVINNCGTGFPHPLGYVLTENFGVPHGMACAKFFGNFVDRCEIFAKDKFDEFVKMTDDIEKVKEKIASLCDVGDAKIPKEEAEKYSQRWAEVLPGNFLASPGSLTRDEAAQMLVIE